MADICRTAPGLSASRCSLPLKLMDRFVSPSPSAVMLRDRLRKDLPAWMGFNFMGWLGDEEPLEGDAVAASPPAFAFAWNDAPRRLAPTVGVGTTTAVNGASLNGGTGVTSWCERRRPYVTDRVEEMWRELPKPRRLWLGAVSRAGRVPADSRRLPLWCVGVLWRRLPPMAPPGATTAYHVMVSDVDTGSACRNTQPHSHTVTRAGAGIAGRASGTAEATQV